MPFSQEIRTEAETLLRQNKKQEAIDLLREKLNIPTEDALRLVEALEGELGIEPPLDDEPETTEPELTQEDKEKISAWEKAGQKLQAVQYIMDTYKVDFDTALNLMEDYLFSVELDNPSSEDQEGKPDIGQKPSGCLPSLFAFITMGMGVLSLASFIIAGVAHYNNVQLIKTGIKTSATVKELLQKDDMYAPVFEYTYLGTIQQYQSTTYSSPAGYEVGETVTLYIDPNNSDNILFDSFTDRWLLIVICCGTGLFFLILSIAFGYAQGRSEKTNDGAKKHMHLSRGMPDVMFLPKIRVSCLFGTLPM